MRCTHLLLALVALFAAGCCCKKLAVPRDPDELKDPLRGAESHSQRQLWRYRFERGLLPDPALLPPMAETVQLRERAAPAAPGGGRPPAVLDVPGDHPYLEILTRRLPRGYDGRVTDVVITADTVKGVLSRPTQPITIRYRTPGRLDYSAVDDQPGFALFLEWQETTVGGSHRTRAALSFTTDGVSDRQLLMATYEWGSGGDLLVDDWATGYGTFNVRQTSVRPDGIARLGVDLDNPDDSGLMPLLPGQDIAFEAPVRVFCLSSTVRPPRRRGLGEGDVSFARLFYYRR